MPFETESGSGLERGESLFLIRKGFDEQVEAAEGKGSLSLFGKVEQF